jgi:hypothetical protein
VLGLENLSGRRHAFLGIPRATGRDSHRQVLEGFLGAAGLGADLAPDVGDRLRKYLRFRHRFTHGYGYEVSWALVEEPLQLLPETMQILDELWRRWVPHQHPEGHHGPGLCEVSHAPAKAAYESLRTVFEAKPPANAAEFETYIQATAATQGWPAVAELCRTQVDRFPDSLWIWLNKAWVFRYVGDEESWGRVVESVLALPPALISTNDQHVPIEIAALGSLPFSADQVRQLDAMINALGTRPCFYRIGVHE